LTETSYQLAADALLIIHGAFIVFVALGAVLLFRWPRLAWLHLPAVVWGVLVELCGWICPLTPWESHLRARGGGTVITGSFIEHYLTPLIYPSWLTRQVQLGLAGAVVAFNVVVYTAMLVRRARGHGRAGSGGKVGRAKHEGEVG